MTRFVYFVSFAADAAATFAAGVRVILAALIVAGFAMARAAAATYRAGQRAAVAYRALRRTVRRLRRSWVIGGVYGVLSHSFERMIKGRADWADKFIISASSKVDDLFFQISELADLMSTIRPVFTGQSVALTVSGRCIRLLQVSGRQVFVGGKLMV